MSFLKRVARSPYLHLLSGIVLVITALAEVFDAEEDPALGVHHGILVAGLVQLLQSLPHLVEGARDLDEAAEVLKVAVAKKRGVARDAEEPEAGRRD